MGFKRAFISTGLAILFNLTLPILFLFFIQSGEEMTDGQMRGFIGFVCLLPGYFKGVVIYHLLPLVLLRIMPISSSTFLMFYSVIVSIGMAFIIFPPGGGPERWIFSLIFFSLIWIQLILGSWIQYAVYLKHTFAK